MKKICEYELLASTSAKDLGERVNKRIMNGWQPYGSPCAVQKCRDAYFAQAVVKYEEEK